MKADMSDTSMSDCILSRIARPSSVSPGADSAASRSRIMSSVYSGRAARRFRHAAGAAA